MLILNFLEEYKRLDNLCMDYLSSNKGVTEYIFKMDNTPKCEQTRVETWDADYKHLKRSRWIRNVIAHQVDVLCTEICTEKDLQWVQDFRARIINGYDPFTILFKTKESLPVGQSSSTLENNKSSTYNTSTTYIAKDTTNTLYAGQAIIAKTHAEFLNKLLHKEYTGYGWCTYKFDSLNILWMIRLDNKASKEGWRNSLTENGTRVVENYIGEDYERLPSHQKEAYSETRYIFDIVEGENKLRHYIFRGTFKFALGEGSNDYRVWKKSSDTVNFKELLTLKKNINDNTLNKGQVRKLEEKSRPMTEKEKIEERIKRLQERLDALE